ncbi:MAG TPA: SgcJ/EcaC family oxidoreductase [Gemmatimonadales bacterium]|nr:SgcJ/EcaC family oxidoreductase [Gemmatimonadales bacterium]
MRAMVSGLLVLFAACKVASPDLSEADRVAIRAATDSFVAHQRARRDSASAELFSEDARFMPPNGGITEGRPAIRAWLAAFPPMANFTLTPIEIEGRGDLAYVRGTYSYTLVGTDGHQIGEDRGKYLEIRRKQPDGKWLMTIDIYNSDLGVPERRP